MLPIKVTEEMRESLDDAKIVTFNAPEGGESEVEPVQGLAEIGVPHRFGPDRIYVPLVPDAEDLQRLNDGQPLWLVFLTHRMPVFQTYVQPLPASPGIILVGGPMDGEYVARDQAVGFERIEVQGQIYVRDVGAFIWSGVSQEEPARDEHGNLAEWNGTDLGPEVDQ